MKTRLAAALGRDAAADLAWAFLEDTLALAAAARREARAELVLAHAPDGIGPRLARLASVHGARPMPQGEGDLGARLARVMGDARSARVAIGADGPDLPPSFVVLALAALGRAPAVLGPAGDGGFHLVGLAAGVASTPLAAGVRWSTAHAAADARRVLGPGALDLAPWDDVDDARDLAALEERLASGASAPRTSAWLAGHPPS